MVNLSPAVAVDLGVDPFGGRGVLVTAVGDDSLAASVGVRPGDLVRQVNGRDVATTADLQAALAAGRGSWRVILQRGDQQITGSFTL